jgi:hypothetical protein
MERNFFFFRNLEVIPQESWNSKAKKRNTKGNVQPSQRQVLHLTTILGGTKTVKRYQWQHQQLSTWL